MTSTSSFLIFREILQHLLRKAGYYWYWHWPKVTFSSNLFSFLPHDKKKLSLSYSATQCLSTQWNKSLNLCLLSCIKGPRIHKYVITSRLQNFSLFDQDKMTFRKNPYWIQLFSNWKNEKQSFGIGKSLETDGTGTFKQAGSTTKCVDDVSLTALHFLKNFLDLKVVNVLITWFTWLSYLYRVKKVCKEG
jgi:hypothetical protein